MSARRFAAAALLFLALAAPRTAVAQSEPLSTRASYVFGREIELGAQVQAGQQIARAAVFYTAGPDASSRVALAQTDRADGSAASLKLDPLQIGLAAFETLRFYWQVDLASGATLRSDELELEYYDDRFDWQSLEAGLLSIHWHDRDLDQGEAALEIGRQALETIARTYSLLPVRPLSVFLYNNARELQAGLDRAGATWVGGTSNPGLGIVLLAASPGPEGQIDLERLIPHELVHLLLEQQSSSSTAWTPAWLAEGLATLAEGSPQPTLSDTLEQAAADDDLIPIGDLCAAFPLDETRAWLAYSESSSFVRYLLDIYGQGGINRLLDAYREGASCTGGIQRVYQRSLEQLQAEWLATLPRQPAIPAWGWLALGTALVAVLVFAAARVLRRK